MLRNKKTIRILDEMIDTAKKGYHRSKHAAAIVKGGKILYVARNKVIGEKNGRKTKHAEANVIDICLAQNRNKKILKGATIYVIRINPNFDYENKNFEDNLDNTKCNPFQNSKPCPKCQSIIDKCKHKYGLLGVCHT